MIRQKRDTWIVEKAGKVHKFGSKDAALIFLGMKKPEPLVEETEIEDAPEEESGEEEAGTDE